MADRWGIEDRYIDASGEERHIAPETIEELRAIIGEPDTEAGPLVVRTDEENVLGLGELILEDGTTVVLDAGARLNVPLGYHTFAAADGSRRRVISCPPRCYLPAGLPEWGWAAQLYATRSRESWGIGDLGDLARLVRWSKTLGAGFTLINPLGAATPVAPLQPSPYYPSSRLFRNPIYLRIEDVPGAAAAPAAVQEAARVGRGLNAERLIDRDRAWELKRAALEAIWDASPPGEDFDRWYGEQPESLRKFAVWSALAETHGPVWRDWPPEYRHPESPAITAVVHSDFPRARFHAWLQWLVERQLQSASRAHALIQDLPIGFDPRGFDAWLWQDLVAAGVSVGAPPDEFNSRGQDWGLPPFIPSRLRAANYEPFIETIRASMAPGGGLRIDHVMGLFRLWWIPAERGAGEGGYVRYPAGDLLGIVALESQRANALVVGEDLGTVEPGVRERMAESNMLSYRLLWFEDDAPSKWPGEAMAAVTTHDLPTVAGLWDGSDLAAQRRLGLQPNEDGTDVMRERLREAGGLNADARPADAVLAAHRLLARAPSVLRAATLDDAVVETERPNIPGADDVRPNWCLALPVPLEEIETHPVASEVAGIMDQSCKAARKV